MSADLERIFSSMLRGEVPAMWAKARVPVAQAARRAGTTTCARASPSSARGSSRREAARPLPAALLLHAAGLPDRRPAGARAQAPHPIDYLSFAYRLLDEPSPEIIEAASAAEDARGEEAAAAAGGRDAGHTCE